MLILIAIVVWFGLCLLLAAGTIFLQNYLFESPPLVKDVALRALAGGTLVGLFYGFWILRASANPLRFAPLMEFSATEPAKEFPKMKAVIDGRVTDVSFNRYEKRYFTMQGKPMPERPEAIIVTEDGTDVKFTPDRSSTTAGQSLKYRDDKGREMDSISLGSITTRHPGWAFGYFILTVVHFLVWLAALWPIMRYGPGYSFLIAVIAWLVGSLVVLPPLIAQAKKVHDREAGVKTAGERRDVSPPVCRVQHRRTDVAPLAADRRTHVALLAADRRTHVAPLAKENEQGRKSVAALPPFCWAKARAWAWAGSQSLERLTGGVTRSSVTTHYLAATAGVNSILTATS